MTVTSKLPSKYRKKQGDRKETEKRREGSIKRERVGFTKNTAMRHRRVGGRAVTVTAMLHRQRYRGIEKEKEKAR